ncbi:MAG: hypothetical protein ACE37H_06815 [Phycisphaeraceae bacterium]
MIDPRTLIVCLLTALALGFTANTAAAQRERPERPDRETPDPAAVAERCIEALDKRADAWEKHITKSGERAVNKIESLLEDGERREAVLVARKAIDNINNDARRCVEGLKRQAERCTQLLERLGAPELAEAVNAAARENAKSVNDARAAAVAAIRDALPDRPDRPDDGE